MKPGDRVIIYRQPGALFHEARGMVEFVPEDADWPVVVSVPDPVRARTIGVAGMAVAHRDELVPDHEWLPTAPPAEIPRELRVPDQAIAAQAVAWQEWVETKPPELEHPVPVTPAPEPEPEPEPAVEGPQPTVERPSQGQMFPRGAR